MELHQIQVTYQTEDDRLLLRVSFLDGEGGLEEVRGWLTRRLTRSLWLGIVRAMDSQVKLNQPQAAHASAEIISMEHYASVNDIRNSGNFDIPFESSAHSYPLGDIPFLITRTRIGIAANRGIRIDFGRHEGEGFEVVFSARALHGFSRLLQEAAKTAEWDLSLRMPSFVQSEAVPKQKLN